MVERSNPEEKAPDDADSLQPNLTNLGVVVRLMADMLDRIGELLDSISSYIKDQNIINHNMARILDRLERKVAKLEAKEPNQEADS